jgi:hypothetical protein
LIEASLLLLRRRRWPEGPDEEAMARKWSEKRKERLDDDIDILLGDLCVICG